MPAVALVTCRVLPEPDPDQEPLLAALRAAGLAADLLAWDDPAADPGAFDLCVLRSSWNYPRDPQGFLAFVDRAERRSRLLNPPSIVRWNLHKRYLLELAAAGVPTVPTVLVERGGSMDLAALSRETGWSDLVIKPAISAASFRTRRFGEGRRHEAQAFLDELAAERDTLIQPYLCGVEERGERALVWIDGELTHAVRKSPRFAGAEESVSEAQPAGAAERDVAERALGEVAGEMLYARVDVVPFGAGPVVAEVELIEPSLFLVQEPRAMTRLVAAIRRRLESRAPNG